MTNEIEWKKIYAKQEIDNCYIGYMDETWIAEIDEGKLIRHIHYDLRGGNESNRIETMVFINEL